MTKSHTSSFTVFELMTSDDLPFLSLGHLVTGHSPTLLVAKEGKTMGGKHAEPRASHAHF